MFRPLARYRHPWCGQVAVLAPGAIPTVDYYVTARLGALPPSALRIVDTSTLPEIGADHWLSGTFWIVARHAPIIWLDWLARHADRWSGVAYLMDDDIPGAWRCGDVPLDYGLWTSGRYWRVRSRLAAVCDRVWFSTSALQRRYDSVPGQVVPPMPFRISGQFTSQGCRRWGYHGTRVHQDEIRWLLPVIRAVQEAVPDAQFEIFGNRRVAAWLRDIPRVLVREPLSWPAYLKQAEANPLAVGLAPILPGRFNSVRSHTKVFDIARSGAVGLFSARDPYATALCGAGFSLLPDEPQDWAESVVDLFTDDHALMMSQSRFTDWLAQCSPGDDLTGLIVGACAELK